MKTKTNLLAMLIILISWSNHALSQTLFKDLIEGKKSSYPEQFINVNGTMYFTTSIDFRLIYQLWKSDGTAANTVLVKDSIVTSNFGSTITFINLNDTLYYMLNKNGSSTFATITELWKTDGTTAGTVLIKTLINDNPRSGTGDAPPGNYTVLGNKLYFQFGSGKGVELWVSDGTTDGTKEVVDLNPGKNGGVFSSMIVYKEKLYFGGSAITGKSELYSSDGTVTGTTLVKGGNELSEPRYFTICNDTLYFQAISNSKEGLWKTDGTAAGTVNVTDTGFNYDAKVFNNSMYYSFGGVLWKSDGTKEGTLSLKDSAGGVIGILNNTIYSAFSIPTDTQPYYVSSYWKSDGTAAGTQRVSDKLGKAASFNIINDKMYSLVEDAAGYATALFESDGTDSGTINLFNGISLSNPFVFNNTFFFTNFHPASGFELWSLSPNNTGVFVNQIEDRGMLIYPNPSSGIFNIKSNNNTNITILVFNMFGQLILSQQNTTEINLTSEPKGVYFMKINDGTTTLNRKIIVE